MALTLLLLVAVLAPTLVVAKAGGPGPGEVQDPRWPWVGDEDEEQVAARRAKAGLSPDELAFLAAHPDITLGADPSWRPAVIENPDGTLSGIDADTIDYINAILGTRIRLRGGSWPELLAMAQRREIDGLTSSFPHPERAAWLSFTGPYSEGSKAIYTLADNPLGLHRLADLEGRRVAYRSSNLLDQKLLGALPGVEPVPLEREADMVNALISGKADAAIAMEYFSRHLMEKAVSSVALAFVLDETLRAVFSIRSDWPLLVSAIDKALATLSIEDRLAIKRRYLGPGATPADPGAVHLTAEEQAWLKARGGRLSYCFSPVWAPLDYLRDGGHRGLFRDYLELFGRKLGVGLDPVPSTDWPETLRLAEERRCDLVSGASPTPEREHYLAFTRPYRTLTMVLLARDEAPFVPNLEHLAGRPIGVPKATAVAAALRERHPDQPMVDYANGDQVHDGILSGRMYAAAVTLEHAADAIRDWPGHFRIIGKLDEPTPISVAVRNDEPILLNIMQKAVESLTPAERDQIEGRQTSFRIEQQVDLTRLWQVLALAGLVGAFLLHRHRELSRLNRRLLAAKEAAEAADRTKGELLANMSHEIRTPLHAVVSLADLGLDTRDPHRLRGYLEEIAQSGRTLLWIVDEILDLARIERGALPIEPAPFELGDVLNQVRATTVPLAREKGIALDCRVPVALSGTWVGDARRLTQVLVNLVGNAVKFTEAGAVTCTIEPVDSVTGPGGKVDGPGLRFRVGDTGIGMSAQQLGRLFAPFYQIDASSTRRFGGVGLGLAIVRSLAELMGGQVSVESRLGEGSVFSVTLPLRRADATDLGATAAPGPTPGASAGQPRTPDPDAPRLALVVEDNPLNRTILTDMLARLGVAAETAANGIEAMGRLIERPRAYGLVLMDVQMPEMDGCEATRRLRAVPALARLPVVAVTAHALAADRDRCLAAGMDDYLTKPLDPERLAQVVRHWLPSAAATPTAGAPGQGAAQGRAPIAAGFLDVPVSLVYPGTGEAQAGHPGNAEAQPWLDTAQGIAYCAGDPDLYLSLLRTFAENQRAAHDGLLSAANPPAGPTPAQLRRVAHNLKGTAPMVGARALGELAAAADVALRPGGPEAGEPDADRAQALGAGLREGLIRTLGEIDALLARVEVTAQEGEAAQAAAAETCTETQTGAYPQARGPRPRLLLVDDEPTNLHLLAEVLARDYDLVCAADGPTALVAATQTPIPDLILLDIGLPEMDGYEVCRRLKADPAGRDIPVIFVTGRVDVADERRGLALGAIDYIHKPFDASVVQARVHNHLALKQQGDALERLSSSDPLTGIPNRRGLDRYLPKVWSGQAAQGRSIAALMMDIDAFKAFNDHYGHSAGDTCLSAVAHALQDLVRERGGLVARYGGEEFIWVLPDADLAQAKTVAEAALAAVRGLRIPHAASPCADIVTLSIGVWSDIPAPGAEPAGLIAEADSRLYLAKRAGRNRIE